MMVLFRSGILCWCWKNPWTPIWNLYSPWVQWPWSDQSPKIQVCHDGALSIRKLILNKAQLIISLFFNWWTTKKCAPYFRGNTEFPIYFYLGVFMFWALNFLAQDFRQLHWRIIRRRTFLCHVFERWVFQHRISGKTSLTNYPGEELSDEEFSALTKK
jgi:hypothetical protein